MPSGDRAQLLPAGSVLLHIGPYKTGSTALQAALFDARDAFADHGVYYPGRWRRAMREGWSALNWSPRGRPAPPPIEFWEAFAADIRQHSDFRTCVSTEDFAATPEVKARKIVEDLGGSNVHVVMVLRRFDKLFPSAWQERVKGHDERSYTEWTDQILNDPDSQAHRAFWRAQDIGRVAENWLPALEPSRFHVVVTDDSRRDLLLRLFEEMLGLPEGILAPPETVNASLSANAVELVRRLNTAFVENGWSDELYHETIYNGATQALITGERTDTDVRIPPLPGWAREPVAELSRKRVQQVRDLGVDVVGDLDALLLPEGPSEEQPQGDFPGVMSLVQAEAAVVGALQGTRKLLERQAREHQRQLNDGGTARSLDTDGDSRRVADTSGRDLLREAGARLVRRVGRR